MAESWTIGGFAAAANVNVETVRYYQRRGLLRQPLRPVSGSRRYRAAELVRVRFIKRAQASGFTLVEIQALLDLSGRRACRASRALATSKLQAVEATLRDLLHVRRDLRRWVASCDANTGSSCPALDRLSR